MDHDGCHCRGRVAVHVHGIPRTALFLVANGNIDGMTWDMAALPVESFREQIDDFPDWFWGTYQAYLEWWFFLPLDPA